MILFHNFIFRFGTVGNTPLDEKFPIPTADGASHAYTQKVDIEHNGTYMNSSDQNYIHVYVTARL